MGGGGGGSGPTVQQQQLETEQALTTANLNLEENSQRKSILNAMQGTRVFRGSALSRAVAGNNNDGAPLQGAPSKAQTSSGAAPPATGASLFDPRTGKQAAASATTAGGVGASEQGAASAAQIAAARASAYGAGFR